MQIFSKLQRNSTYYFIIILLILLINLFNSSFAFFPLFLGVVLFCGDFFIGLFFIVCFSLLHSFNIWILSIFYLFYKFFFMNKLYEYFDNQYFDVINLLLVYLSFFVYLYLYNLNIHFDFIYIIYNFSFDLLLVRIFKCEAKLSY